MTTNDNENNAFYASNFIVKNVTMERLKKVVSRNIVRARDIKLIF